MDVAGQEEKVEENGHRAQNVGRINSLDDDQELDFIREAIPRNHGTTAEGGKDKVGDKRR